MSASPFRIGDAVRVKKGIECPDFPGLEIGGWQGWIARIDLDEEGQPLYSVAWDSITLKALPEEYVEESEEEELDPSEMALSAEDLEPARPRGTPRDAAKVRNSPFWVFPWSTLGEQGGRIRQIVADALDDWDAVEAWKAKLEQTIEFPYRARISEDAEESPLVPGQEVTITGIAGINDVHGIFVNVETEDEGETYTVPLSDIEGDGEDWEADELIGDYGAWDEDR